MNWFKNLKIRTKLITCFAILSVVTVFVGVMGVSNMNNINHRAEEMYHENFISVEELMEIQISLQDIRANHISALYEHDPVRLVDRMETVSNLVEKTNESLENYESMIEDEEDRILYETVLVGLGDYRKVRDANIQLLQSQKYSEAMATYDEVRMVRAKLDNDIQVLVDYNTELAASTIEQNSRDFKQQTTIMVIIILIGVLAAMSIGLVLSSYLGRQLNELVRVADSIADGDLDVTVNIDSKDEVGVLARAFQEMSENINNVLSNINVSSEQVSTGAKQVSESSMSLSQGATEQASSVQQLTSSLEEISSQTTLNADNANRANDLANTVRGGAEQGDVQMADMLKAMDDINESSNSISKVIKVIDDIAFQTNILALNAAVEAARAGQHGRGFAVVAEEVRTLAARSADAARETTEMIEGSIEKAEGGTRIARDTAKSLDEIVEGIEEVAELVEEIATASNEQASAIDQINQGILQVSDVVQMNSATSEESAAASEELSSQAGLLKDMVNKFKLKTNTSMGAVYEQMSPEVANMLDNMSPNSSNTQDKISQISLSDNEFGKY